MASEVAIRFEFADDPVGGAFGYTGALRDVAQPDTRLLCDARQDVGVVCQEAPAVAHVRRSYQP